MPDGGRDLRVAAIYDVHGNLFALDAVLRDIAEERIDLIVSGGDIALGPMPRETLDRLLTLEGKTRFVRGNTDRAVGVANAHGRSSVRPSGDVQWCAGQITTEQRRFLRSQPLTTTVHVGGIGHVLFCHASPRDDDEPILADTPQPVVAAMLAGVKETVVACGHTHAPLDRRIGLTHRIVNGGSVGLPVGARGAYWLLLGPEVTFRRTEYDYGAAAERILATGAPGRERFAAHILEPPAAIRSGS